MTLDLPDPVDLTLPEGRPEELGDLATRLAGVAFHVGVLDLHLTGPAASAPGWLGADSSAAAEQVGRTAALTRQMAEALTTAWHRLDAHSHLLTAAIARIRALKSAQDDEWARVLGYVSPTSPVGAATGLPDMAAAPMVEELWAAEGRRAREHAQLLDHVAHDAADASRVLIQSCKALGGAGAPEDGGRVLAYLALQLPGWGAPELAELARQGSAVGVELRNASPDTLVAVLKEHESMLAAPPFAAALITALGPEALRRFAVWAGVAKDPQALPVMLGALMGAADSVADGDRRLRSALEAPLGGSIDAVLAVGLGRIAAAPGFTADYRATMVVRLAEAERAWPMLRRDELSVARAEDPLNAAMSGLATTLGAAEVAARVLSDHALWQGLLYRDWTFGTTGLAQLLRTAAGAAHGGDAALVALDAIGGAVNDQTGRMDDVSGAFTFRIGPALADVVAVHLDQVTAPVVAAEGRPGVPRELLDDVTLRQLAGIGMITRNLQARNTLLGALVHKMQAALPDPAAGEPAPAAFATGGLFAAMAFGERQGIRQGLYDAVDRAAADSAAWSIIGTAMGFLPLSGMIKIVRDAATTSMSFVGPGGVPIGAFFAQPQTGAFQASFAAVAATVPGLVKAGSLPDPGTALDNGLWTPEARAYEASLSGPQRDLWIRVRDGADGGYLVVGDGLGLLPGSSSGGK